MYFVVLLAFALLLTDDLPPELIHALWGVKGPLLPPSAMAGALATILAQFLILAISAALIARSAGAKLDGTAQGHDRAANTLSIGQRILLAMLAAALIVTMILTPWSRLVRMEWGLGRYPLVGDLVVIAPFLLSLLLIWTILYRVELRIRTEALAPEPDGPPRQTDATAALLAARHSALSDRQTLGTYLFDKMRHQVLIIAAPMCLVVFAKHFLMQARVPLLRATGLPWAVDSLLGLVGLAVLAISPILLRYIWATEPLPDGPLRRRFERICRRIGLRYKNILLWHTHRITVNAAVMGFAAPLRYILLSDALLETMSDEEIEAVFAHEAGHVRHHHLLFFMLFVAVTMYIAQGCLELLVRTHVQIDAGLQQLLALLVLVLCWLFGFGWLSRRFERQADLFAVRCVTPDVGACVAYCPIHGPKPGPGICTAAANLFGRTLSRIADLNGIPRDAPSWRHGSIQSRYELLERFVTDWAVLRRFDRQLVLIKIGLVVATLIGTAVAIWLYWPELSRLLGV